MYRDLLEKQFGLRNDALFPVDLSEDRNGKTHQPRNGVLNPSRPGLHEHLLHMETVSHMKSVEEQQKNLLVDRHCPSLASPSDILARHPAKLVALEGSVLSVDQT